MHARKLRGLEALKQFGTVIFKTFPDFHETMEDIIAEGDKVWVRNTITGTHKGKYRGLAPTGKKFTEASVDIFRIVDGKLVEGWNVTDELDFLKQLGVIEYKGFPDEVK
jgi:C-1 hydroxylase